MAIRRLNLLSTHTLAISCTTRLQLQKLFFANLHGRHDQLTDNLATAGKFVYKANCLVNAVQNVINPVIQNCRLDTYCWRRGILVPQRSRQSLVTATGSMICCMACHAYAQAFLTHGSILHVPGFLGAATLKEWLKQTGSPL